MLLNSDYIYPTEITGYVRQALADFEVNRFTLSQYLPSTMIDDMEYRLLAGGTGLADAATFRSFDAESPIGRRQTVNRLIGELPPLSQKLRCGEYERLRMRKVTDDRVRQELFNDAAIITRNLAARMELARGDALANGSVTISENGVGVVVDYGRSTAHNVTAAVPWTNAASDPLQDIMSWRDTYLATNGVDPETMLLSRRTWNILLRNTAVRAQVFGGQALQIGGSGSSVVTQMQLNSVFAAQGLPSITLYQSQINVNNVAQKVIPDNKVILLPEVGPGATAEDAQLGSTLWGTTAESLDPRFGLAGDEPGITCGVYNEEDPISMWTKGAAIGLPVLANPNLSFAATVF